MAKKRKKNKHSKALTHQHYQAQSELVETTAPPADDIIAFPFGEPESALLAKPVDYMGITLMEGEYYSPPVGQTGLARLMRMGAHHSGCIHFKVNLLVRDYQPNNVLSVHEFKKLAMDYLVMANGYVMAQYNRLGHIIKLFRAPAIRVRRRPQQQFGYLDGYGALQPFKPGEILHLKEPDPEQDIYGKPQWLGAADDIMVNEAATLFRLKYYKNGAHMGFVLVLSDPTLSEKDVQAIQENVKKSKGIGNFKSLFLNIGDRNKNADDAIKLIPIGEMKTNSDWDKVKDTTRDSIMSAHRVPPVLAGMLPELNGGAGDLDKVMKNFYENEIRPLQVIFEQINDYLPNKPIQFKQPTWGNENASEL